MLKISVLALSVMLSCSAALAAGHGMNHNAESNRQSISNQQNERPVTEMEYMQVQEVEIVEHNDANMPQEMQKIQSLITKNIIKVIIKIIKIN